MYPISFTDSIGILIAIIYIDDFMQPRCTNLSYILTQCEMRLLLKISCRILAKTHRKETTEKNGKKGDAEMNYIWHYNTYLNTSPASLYHNKRSSWPMGIPDFLEKADIFCSISR